MLIFGVDIGTIRRLGGFSWAAVDEAGVVVDDGSDDVAAVARSVVATLRKETVAIAFEAPLAVPVPEDWRMLGAKRVGEGSRPWSASAGTTALATGLVQAAWILRQVARELPDVRVTTQPKAFGPERCRLLVGEALVSAEGKPEVIHGRQDHADAVAAAKRMLEVLSSPGPSAQSDVSCADGHAFNLAAAACMYAGLKISSAELSVDVLVAKAKPARET